MSSPISGSRPSTPESYREGAYLSVREAEEEIPSSSGISTACLRRTSDSQLPITSQNRSLISHWKPSTDGVVSLASGLTGLLEGQANINPELIATLDAGQRPFENKIIRNTTEGTSTIEFRPKHGLFDTHSIAIFLEDKGGFAGSSCATQKECAFNGKPFKHASAMVRNRQDLVEQKYKQVWEGYGSRSSESYEIPDSGYRVHWFEKKSIDEIERQLSYQKRMLQVAVDIMNSKQKSSDREIPFDPAFKRIFVLTEKDHRNNKVAFSKIAAVNSVFFEYKTKIVPLQEEEACIAEVDNAPTRTVNEICEAIKTRLVAHPIKMVDLHAISHLLQELGGFASSSAHVEREYTIDGKDFMCTTIVLRNHQDLVTEKYLQLWGEHHSQQDELDKPPKCNYPVPRGQKNMTSEAAAKQLNYQKQLLQRAVEAMHISGQPFDALFTRIYVSTDQERMRDGIPISDIAQVDNIVFVYRTLEEENLSDNTIDEVCEAIKAKAKEISEVTPPQVRLTLLDIVKGHIPNIVKKSAEVFFSSLVNR